MKYVLKASVQNFAQDELRDLINPDTLERIKKKDPNPQFKAFVVAHEGEAEGQMVDTGRMTMIQYFREAIYKIGNALRFGTPAFYRHEGNDGTGNNTNRPTLGELVGKTFREIGGKLHAIAAFYVYPQFKDKNLNAASYEADIELSMDGGMVRVDDVSRITGVALSDKDRPGFPGATLLATMQAFRISHSGSGGGDKVTLAELKEAIRTGGFKITDLFAHTEIIAVPEVVEWKNKEKQSEYEHRKRIERDLQEERDGHGKTKESLSKQLDELKNQNLFATSEGLLVSIGAERKLSTQQLAHAKKNFGTFKTEAKNPEVLKTDLQKFLDAQIKDYDDVLKIAGLEPAKHGGTGSTPPAGTGTGTGAGAGAGTGDQTQTGDGKDLSVPENNPLIPQEPAKK